MGAALVVLVWLLNFGISIWNAYAVGLAWVAALYGLDGGHYVGLRV